MNRARTDFFRDVKFGARARASRPPETIYPASTGIGTGGSGIAMAAMALDSRRQDVVTTLVSGTASIVNAKSVHPGDVARQTEQTIENIERLIAPENFARHGLAGAGARLQDIAKLRVYVKRPEDYERCRAVVEQRLPSVPAIYLHADVCRPELLVEIEAVACSPFHGGAEGLNGQATKGAEEKARL